MYGFLSFDSFMFVSSLVFEEKPYCNAFKAETNTKMKLSAQRNLFKTNKTLVVSSQKIKDVVSWRRECQHDRRVSCLLFTI